MVTTFNEWFLWGILWVGRDKGNGSRVDTQKPLTLMLLDCFLPLRCYLILGKAHWKRLRDREVLWVSPPSPNIWQAAWVSKWEASLPQAFSVVHGGHSLSRRQFSSPKRWAAALSFFIGVREKQRWPVLSKRHLCKTSLDKNRSLGWERGLVFWSLNTHCQEH